MTGIFCALPGVVKPVSTGRTAKTVTASGNAQISTAQSKFGGASALFDGNGDYLNSATGFSFTGNFTVEFWVRFNSVGANSRGLASDRPPTTSGYTSTNWYIEKNTNDGLYAGIQGNGDIISANSLITTNTWYHIAFVRSGSSVKLYLDGTERGTALTYSGTVGDGDITFGAIVGLYLDGYMDEIRVSNTARYTANFTPSTTAFTNDTNTVLLLHCNGSNTTTVFTDDIGTNAIPRTPRTITVGGNAKISTAQNKFGTASALFDGSSDYLSVPGFSDLAFGTGDFTLEAFVRQSARSDQMVIIDTRNSGNTSGGFILYMRADNYMELYWNSALVSSANPLPTVDTWYHVAVCRSGTSLKVFVDGTSVISVTDSQNHSAAGPFIVGQDFQLTATPGNSWNGYIDEVRFSATARYTANFTAPSAAFTNDRDTLLLLHCDGTNNSTTFTDDNA